MCSGIKSIAAFFLSYQIQLEYNIKIFEAEKPVRIFTLKQEDAFCPMRWKQVSSPQNMSYSNGYLKKKTMIDEKSVEKDAQSKRTNEHPPKMCSFLLAKGSERC